MEFAKNDKLYDLDTLIKKANIFYGSGGSSNAILVYKNTVAKLIPDMKKDFNTKDKFKNDQEEIKFYKEFTTHLVLKNKTPHIVGYYDNKKINMHQFLDKYMKHCKDEKKTLWQQLLTYKPVKKPKKPIEKPPNKSVLETVFTFIKSINPLKSSDKKTKKNYATKPYKTYGAYVSYQTKKNTASMFKENVEDIVCQYEKINGEYVLPMYYPQLLERDFDLCYVEYCPTSIDKEFETLINKSCDIDKKILDVSAFLNRVVFQFMFTMCAIYERYPSFIHNDCFLRNILAVNDIKYKQTDYVEYVIINKKGEQKKYYMPANGICIKLNDFGYSFAMPEIGDKLSFEEKIYMSKFITDKTRAPNFTHTNKYKSDIWNFLYDLYNGSNFGAYSCMTTIKQSKQSPEEKTKLQNCVKTIMNTYIDTDVVDKVKERDSYNLLYGLWNIINIPELQQTIQYPENYFVNDFNFKEYRMDVTEKTDKMNIVKTFTVHINK